MARVPQPRRGEIWQVRFDPSIGAEIRKQRPAVVLNPDGTGKLPLRIVVPITDWQPAFGSPSWFVFLRASADHGLSKDSGADAFQVKLKEKTGLASMSEITKIIHAIEGGDPHAAAQLLPLVYDELRGWPPSD